MKQDSFENLFLAAQAASVESLADLSKRGKIETSWILQEPTVHSFWMALILLTSKDLKLTFKVHFTTEDAVFFASGAFGNKAQSASQNQGIDLFRECCNLTAGKLKAYLSKNGIMSGQSLPALARGFDEVFFPKPVGSSTRSWNLKVNDKSISCSVQVEAYNSVHLNPITQDADAERGDVQFL